MDIPDLESFLNNSLQEAGESMNYTNGQWEAASNSFDIDLTADNDVWDQYIQEPPSSDNSCLESPESPPDDINNTDHQHFREKRNLEEFPGRSSGVNLPRILSFGDSSSRVELHAMPAVRKIVNRSRTTRSRPDLANREHVIAERKRREKIAENLIALSAIVPGLKKRDKASVLTKTIEYMKQMQEKVKMLEEQVAARVTDVDAELTKEQSKLVSVSSIDEGNLNIDIKASGNTYLIKIHCFQASKGTFVKVLNLIESLHLKVVTANSVQFSEQILDLTITSQVEEGFDVEMKDLFSSLKMGLKNEFVKK